MKGKEKHDQICNDPSRIGIMISCSQEKLASLKVTKSKYVGSQLQCLYKDAVNPIKSCDNDTPGCVFVFATWTLEDHY